MPASRSSLQQQPSRPERLRLLPDRTTEPVTGPDATPSPGTGGIVPSTRLDFAHTARIITYNTLTGGIDSASDEQRRQGQVDFLATRAPDVLVLQDLKGWEEGGWWRLWELADAVGMVALPPVLSTRERGSHLAMLYRPGTVRVAAYDAEADAGAFFHGLARAIVYIKDAPQLLTVLGTHLSLLGGEERLAEARWLARYGDSDGAIDRRGLLAGDLNTIGLADDEPDWSRIPANLRSRHCLLAMDGEFGPTDRRAMQLLAAAGFHDPYELLDRQPQHTTGYWADDELIGHRSDFILANRLAAPAVRDITVHESATMWSLSDHLPVEMTIALTPSETEGEL
ncbi:endonuclease/exonuclease/phosphatase family protein [Streptomyces hesseae]|uniref:Endonuclease/exonuclease/phosphatase n=1 Tax=Streptomyces hesseae TaxID=3075519 RepID=A0ABU2SXP0_9ACTN|nr:endonuclease/exonuclease/phosphatase family protein [Streptomyces sp. DSM 40473]MDT0453773.1 endonuclease/exonuclease/phosphatase [Streptomyces sp. DSM 40473]